MSGSVLVSAAAVLAGGIVLVIIERQRVNATRRWIERQVNAFAQVEPEPYEFSKEPEIELSLTEVPVPLRVYFPTPPFVGFVYHPTCMSCRELWREIIADPALDRLVLVHAESKGQMLRSLGALRSPSVPLPDQVVDQIPSGFAFAVDPAWQLINYRYAQVVAELYDLLPATRTRAG